MERGSSSPHTCDVDAAIAAVREQHAEVTRQAEARQRVHQTARSIADRVHGKPSTAERLVTWWDGHQPAATVVFVALLVATLGGPVLGFAVDWVAVVLVAVSVVALVAVAAVKRAGSPPRDARAATSQAAMLLLDDGCTSEVATEAMLRAEGERIDPYAVAVAIRNSNN